jgi:hypothetical protein
MLYDTTYINRNFLLKVSGKDNNNQPINKLVGVRGAKELIGEELLSKFVHRAIASKNDKTKCCLRRGLRITFYNK